MTNGGSSKCSLLGADARVPFSSFLLAVPVIRTKDNVIPFCFRMCRGRHLQLAGAKTGPKAANVLYRMAKNTSTTVASTAVFTCQLPVP